MKCLIVEDEPLSQEVLAGYIAGCPDLDLVGTCADAFQAGEIMRKEQIDLLFLDINLPRLSGIRFLKTITSGPLVIFTTAYPEFAVEGFEADAVDYLLKPFSFERFLRAVNKAMERAGSLAGKNPPAVPQSEQPGGFILLRSDKKIYKVNFSEIICIEATGDYLKVVMESKTLVIHETMKNMLDQLPSGDFYRVHKSFIVALDKISYLEGNRIRTSMVFIPIGQVYKEGLLERLKNPG
jgi:DNA-binding LytR/AlgR family response regulator